jgi:hypothetical protein
MMYLWQLHPYHITKPALSYQTFLTQEKKGSEIYQQICEIFRFEQIDCKL